MHYDVMPFCAVTHTCTSPDNVEVLQSCIHTRYSSYYPRLTHNSRSICLQAEVSECLCVRNGFN